MVSAERFADVHVLIRTKKVGHDSQFFLFFKTKN
jgi:hypothetical protein